MPTPDDRLMALGSPTPMLACKKGVSERPGYRDCKNCNWTNYCDLFQTELMRRKSNKLIQERIDKGFENPRRYKIDASGHYVLDENFLKQERAENQKNLNQKVLQDYRDDLKTCKTFSDKVKAFFRLVKNSWNQAKKISRH